MTGNTPQAPLFVIVDGDPCWFKSIQEADGYLESYDIALMSGFDSLGRRLRFQAGKTKERKYLVDIDLESEEVDIESFRRVIIEQLYRTASAIKGPLKDKNWEELSLEELIQGSLDFWHWEMSFFFNFDKVKAFLSRLFSPKNNIQ